MDKVIDNAIKCEDTVKVCGCSRRVDYIEDMCEAHQQAYEEYKYEVAPEDRMTITEWLRWV